MRKVCTFVISVVLSVGMLVSLVGCNSTNKEIENLLTEFEYACNTLDFDAVLNCLNPKTAEKIKMAAGIYGMFTKLDTDEVFEKLAEYLSRDDVGGAEFFSSIEIEIKEISTEDETTVVSALLAYESGGTKVNREATFNCVYYAERWYISSFSID